MAIGPGEMKLVLAIVVVILSVVGQAVAKWQELKKPVKRGATSAPRPKPPSADPLAEEIGEFLRRAAQRRGPPPPARPAVIPAEVIEPRPATVRPAGVPQSPDLVLQDVEPDGGVGQSVREHLGEPRFNQLNPELGKEVLEADEKMESHLHQVFDHRLSRLSSAPGPAAPAGTAGWALAAPGSDAAPESPASADQNPLAASLAAMLANPTTIRQAVLLQEILHRPEERWQ
jgi:hypothetical protein